MRASRMLRISYGLGLTLLLGLAAPAPAAVRSITLGITLNCPYGLAG